MYRPRCDTSAIAPTRGDDMRWPAVCQSGAMFGLAGVRTPGARAIPPMNSPHQTPRCFTPSCAPVMPMYLRASEIIMSELPPPIAAAAATGLTEPYASLPGVVATRWLLRADEPGSGRV